MVSARSTFAVAAALALLLTALVMPAASRPDPVALLVTGDSVFWSGPYIKRASNFDGNGCADGKCFVYHLKVVGRGARLRVALDYPMGNDWIDFRLFGPDGKRIRGRAGGFYSREIFVPKPEPGTYRIVVIPRSVSKSSFRMRAKLEGPRQPPTGRRLLAPNLRVEPPFDFTFKPPGLILPFVFTNIHVLKDPCALDEKVEDGAQKCLRFSVGPQNAGDGPLELRFSPATDALVGEAPMYQVLNYSDGSTRERRAGTYEFHKTHGHYHFSGFATLRLFRVVDAPSGEMKLAGNGHKSGFCFGDVMMNSWHKFIQDRAYSSRSSCGDLQEAYMGLSTGWTDIYDWSTPGNYVEFSDNPDGLYVVRATVDDANKILETNEHDNISYAYIRVRGKRVTLLERGHGSSPWDPNKTVVVDWVEALRR